MLREKKKKEKGLEKGGEQKGETGLSFSGGKGGRRTLGGKKRRGPRPVLLKNREDTKGRKKREGRKNSTRGEKGKTEPRHVDETVSPPRCPSCSLALTSGGKRKKVKKKEKRMQ